jgi:hypothetical protein
MSDSNFAHAGVSGGSQGYPRYDLLWTAALVVSLLLAASHTALAQQPAQSPAPALAEPTAAQRATARAWFTEGKQLYARKDYARALQHFDAAYRLVRIPSLGIEVAMTQAVLRQWVEASATAVDIERLPQAPRESADDASARAEAKKLLHNLTPRIPTLTLAIAPSKANATVTIDDAEMPAPRAGTLSYRLNPGSHRLTIAAQGYLTQEHGFDLDDKEEADLSVTLIASPTAIAQPVIAPPAPAAHPLLEPERTAPAASVARVEAAAPDSGALTRGYVALGVAGVGAAVGTVTGILAITRKPDCPGNRCRPEQRSDADASGRFGNIATVSFGVGVAAGAYGLWELLINDAAPSDVRASSLHVTRSRVVAAPGGASIELSGTF